MMPHALLMLYDAINVVEESLIITTAIVAGSVGAFQSLGSAGGGGGGSVYDARSEVPKPCDFA